MANLPSSKKRIRQDAKRRARNRWRLKAMRAVLKDLESKLQHGNADEANAAFRVAAKTLDRTAQRGTIHRNTAARTKSRLARRVKAKALASA